MRGQIPHHVDVRLVDPEVQPGGLDVRLFQQVLVQRLHPAQRPDDEGAVRPPAITEYPIEDAAEAHRVSEGRHLQGKLVLMVR